MPLSYNVRIWEIDKYKGKRRTTYRVRWTVDGNVFSERFAARSLAVSFRADLISAQARGEAFDVDKGLPVSMMRAENAIAWFALACKYVDAKWPRAAAKSRSGIADALATATFALLSTDRGRPADTVLRRAMTGWAFNLNRRDTDKPAEIVRALAWLSANTVQASSLDELATVRRVLDTLALKMDGKPAAAKTVTRKRAVLYNIVEYGRELGALTSNRIAEVKWVAPKVVHAIDKRIVINPQQGRKLLRAVRAQGVPGQVRRSVGPTLEAFFGAMYYAGLRPEEAVVLSKPDLLLPESGWGELLLSRAAPIAGSAWTDSGERRDDRQLKSRGVGEVRSAPCPPPLTALLHRHIRLYGVGPDGRLFRSLTGDLLAESTIARSWDNARREAFTPEEYASPLCRRPYDLRHACASTWLESGVSPKLIAAWIGHSVEVLLKIYAAILAGIEDSARGRIDGVLGWSEEEDES